tara:strand:- start:25197 stop:25385 length:189 start_codon:yes stop_codon:yes gene_type:complete
MKPFDDNPTIEGLRHARNQIYKQWDKERQRAASHKERIEELLKEIVDLKRKLEFLSDRYLGD